MEKNVRNRPKSVKRREVPPVKIAAPIPARVRIIPPILPRNWESRNIIADENKNEIAKEIKGFSMWKKEEIRKLKRFGIPHETQLIKGIQ